MDSSVMELLDAHDILRPGHINEQILKDFLRTLKDFQCLSTCDQKKLQTFSSSVNNCLNSQSQKDKYHGLCALDILLQQCSSEYLEQNIGSYINSIVNQIFKASYVELQTLNRACQVMTKIIEFAPAFPDASRQLSALASTLITNVTDLSNKLTGSQVGLFHCISKLMSNYPGACGAVATNVKLIETMLIKQMTSNDVLLAKQLAKCYALLPRLGGGGKDGINHMESWKSYSAKIANTIHHKILQVFNILPSSNKKEINKPIIDIPEDFYEKNNILREVYSLKAQIRTLCSCFMELHVTPAPFLKTVNPTIVFEFLKLVSKTPLAQIASGLSHEYKVVLAVMPDIHVSLIQLTRDFITFGTDDLALFIPDIIDYIVNMLGDIRQVGGIRQSGRKAFGALKECLYELLVILCDTYGAGLGIEKHADEIIPYLISDIVPASETVTLNVKGSVNKNSSKKQKKGSNQQFGIQHNREFVNKKTSSLLVSSSLLAISSIVKACGSFISESCHKNLQCFIVGSAFDLQQSNVQARPVPYDDACCRSSLYEALFDLISNPHPRWPAPFRYGYRIFRLGHLNDYDPKVKMICAKGLCLCESLSQPRSQSLSWDAPITKEEIESIKKEMMKIHTIIISSDPSDSSHLGIVPISNDHVNGDDGATDSPEFSSLTKESGSTDITEKESNAPEKGNKKDYTSEYAYKLLSGKEKLEPSKEMPQNGVTQSDNDDDAYVVPDASEREELLKSMYNLDQDPIFIPEEVRNRKYKTVKAHDDGPQETKRAKMSDESQDQTEELVDLETMLSTFVG